jgi:hypothetical protein
MHPLSDEYDESKDRILVSDARAGSPEAMEALARAHERFIYNIALRMVRDPHDAADLTQEILLKMLANLSKFENKEQFSQLALSNGSEPFDQCDTEKVRDRSTVL